MVGDTIEERLLKLGEERDGMFEVESGTKNGDKIVIKLTPEVHDGAKVK